MKVRAVNVRVRLPEDDIPGVVEKVSDTAELAVSGQ